MPDDDELAEIFREANRIMRTSDVPGSTPEQRLKMYRNIQRQIQGQARDYFTLGFLAGFLGGAGAVLFLTAGKT